MFSFVQWESPIFSEPLVLLGGVSTPTHSPADYNYAVGIFWGSIGLLSLLCGLAYHTGRKGIENLCAVYDMKPLTRANTADLPAPDTLVRASSEPMQAQQAVLLRAAAEGQETPQEEMLRASVGQE